MKAFCVTLIFLFVLTSFAQTKKARKIDELVSYNCEDAMARLDNFAIDLQIDPLDKAYLIFYEGTYPKTNRDKKDNSIMKRRFPKIGEALSHANVLQHYLVKSRGINKGRVIIINGGYRQEHAIEIWSVPSAATPPEVSPTLDKSKVRFGRGKPNNICSELF